MKKRVYERKPGEMEIRVLSDGRVVFVAPDEKLINVAEEIAPNELSSLLKRKGGKHDRDRSE